MLKLLTPHPEYSGANIPQNACDMIFADYDMDWNCIPSTQVNEQIMYTAVVGGMVWVIAMMLAIKAFRATYKAKGIYNTRMRNILLVYVVTMALFSTGGLVQQLADAYFQLFVWNGGPKGGYRLSTLLDAGIAVSLPFAILGADGLMAWRCCILYQGVRRPLRIFVFFLLSSLLFGSLASGILTLAVVLPDISNTATPLLGTTITINLILAILITSRLLFHERALRKINGAWEKKSPFVRIIAMCVESCAMIILCAVLAVGMGYAKSDFVFNLVLIPLALLVHICVISPLLILIRVGNGRSVTTLIPPHHAADEEEGVTDKRRSMGSEFADGKTPGNH